jgi:streptomycin 6-kinase
MVYNPGISIGTSIGALDRNPALARLVPARVEQLADQTGIDADRVVAWAFVKAVLSELWTWEDGERAGGRALDVAQLLASRLP